MRKLSYKIWFSLFVLFFFAVIVLAAATDRYIDPDCEYNGDGTTYSCAAGAGQEGAYNTWAGISFNASYDYYQKCATTDTISSNLSISSITATELNNMTLGAYYGSGTIGVSGNKPILQHNDNSGTAYTVFIQNSSYIEIANLDVRKGRAAIQAENLDNGHIHDCDIGAGTTGWLVRLTSDCDSNIVEDNTVDTKIATYGQISAYLCTEDTGGGPGYAEEAEFQGTDCPSTGPLFDSILITYYSDSNIVRRNDVIDPGDDGIIISYYSHNNQVYHNSVTAPNNGCSGTGGRSTDCGGNRPVAINHSSNNNLVHHNYFGEMFYHSPVQGGGNELCYNIWAGTTRTGIHGVIVLISDWDNTDVTNIKLYNNDLYNAGSECVRLMIANNNRGPMTYVDVSNNICYDWADWAFHILDYSYPTIRITDVTFKNNVIYDSGSTSSTDVVRWYKQASGTNYTIAESNALNGTDDFAIANNAFDASDLLNDPANDDFTLPPGSGAIDAGLTLGASYDDAWDPATSMPPNAVTTLDQDDYGSEWKAGTYGYLPKIFDASPPDNATDISVDVTLTWSNPIGANSVTVYFDEDEASCPPASPTQVASGSLYTSYNPPGSLGTGKKCCWEVKVVHDGGTQDGDSYEFTTAGGPPPPAANKSAAKFDDGAGTAEFNDGGIDIK